jgi:hypothetical protein
MYGCQIGTKCPILHANYDTCILLVAPQGLFV